MATQFRNILSVIHANLNLRSTIDLVSTRCRLQHFHIMDTYGEDSEIFAWPRTVKYGIQSLLVVLRKEKECHVVFMMTADLVMLIGIL